MNGKNNPRYKDKIVVKCNNCGKPIEKKPSLMNNKNKDGENHNFCCYECYWQFRKKYYVGDKLYNTGLKMSEEFCNKVRSATLRQYSNGKLDRQTIPQQIVNKILEQNNIRYINEKTFTYYSVDNFLEDYNLIIEVMGDYFHANPNTYTDYKQLNSMQIKDINRDKRKNTFIKRYNKINILYLWENEIKNNQEMCEKLILEYIKNNGKLNDYNSFNFSLCGNELIQNNNISKSIFFITP